MPEYHASFPSTYGSVRRARAAVVTFAQARGFHGQELRDIENAVGEALANAAEHGHRDAGSFDVHARGIPGGIEIEVKDKGRGFDSHRALEPGGPVFDRPRGFGIYIMRQLMDEVRYTNRGTRLLLRKRFGANTTDEWAQPGEGRIR